MQFIRVGLRLALIAAAIHVALPIIVIGTIWAIEEWEARHASGATEG